MFFPQLYGQAYGMNNLSAQKLNFIFSFRITKSTAQRRQWAPVDITQKDLTSKIQIPAQFTMSITKICCFWADVGLVWVN